MNGRLLVNGHHVAGFLAPMVAGLWLRSRPHVSQALSFAAATGTVTMGVVTSCARRHGQRPAAPLPPRISLPGAFDGVPVVDRGATRRAAAERRPTSHPAVRFYVDQGIRRFEELLAEQAGPIDR